MGSELQKAIEVLENEVRLSFKKIFDENHQILTRLKDSKLDLMQLRHNMEILAKLDNRGVSVEAHVVYNLIADTIQYANIVQRSLQRAVEKVAEDDNE